MLWAYPAQALMVSWCKCVATLPLDMIPASKNSQGSLCQSLYLICIHGFFSVDLSGLVPKPCSICSSSWKGGLLCAESPPCVILVIAASPTSPSCADLCSVTLAVSLLCQRALVLHGPHAQRPWIILLPFSAHFPALLYPWDMRTRNACRLGLVRE